MRLILASSSPYRCTLMDRLRLPYRSLAPDFEEKLPGQVPDPRTLVLENALGKAGSLLAAYPDCLIIGSDQVAVCEGEVLRKPGTVERAIEQLQRLAGREHELLTAVAVVGRPEDRAEGTAGKPASETALAINRLRMRPLSHGQAKAYVLQERPLDCAGAYKAEGLGIVLFEHLQGNDPTAIMGLPLIALTELLRRFGADPLREAGPGT